jgi:hypothetical protein
MATVNSTLATGTVTVVSLGKLDLVYLERNGEFPKILQSADNSVGS